MESSKPSSLPPNASLNGHISELAEVWQQTLSWQPTPAQQDSYQQFYQAILQGNQRLNLTRITEPQDFWEKHLWDSLVGIQPWLSQPSKPLQVADVGTGAGFPGIPVAIACPSWQLTLLDSIEKKIAFLETTGQALGLTNIRPAVGRAEQIGQLPAHREQYDLALIRAVATASVCAEYTVPLLKLGGTAVLYRGQWSDSETADLQRTVQVLGATVEQIKQWMTPLSHSVRHCVYLQKTAPTPSTYPRAVGMPTQKPL
jgi:16S rRNA (guanine527-N7)-methyltransferase